jgi:hypothetical protein
MNTAIEGLLVAAQDGIEVRRTAFNEFRISSPGKPDEVASSVDAAMMIYDARRSDSTNRH